MRWFENPNFDFVGKRRIALAISGTLVAIAIISVIVKGVQYGIAFKGGKEFVVQFQKAANVSQIRNDLSRPLNGAPVVKRYGSPKEILIRTDAKGSISDVEHTINTVLNSKNNPANVIKTDIVGPRFAKQLKQGAFEAILFAMIVIFIYILIRFKNWAFSLGAVVALCHDVLITLGVFTIFSNISPFSMQIDESLIGAFLTIVGYSLNDTVVVYDRVRENMQEYKTMDYMEMINKSLNDTLSRTIITALTTFFVVAVLFFFGGQVLKGFSFALMLGILVGTYSSLFVATGLVVELKVRRQEKT
ncbi:MAG TPA: protein translocase subunit SecF [Balneolaceae bacterium]|nr:protein translocase subunit SecF [Balneolaceae bacterium]